MARRPSHKNARHKKAPGKPDRKPEAHAARPKPQAVQAAPKPRPQGRPSTPGRLRDWVPEGADRAFSWFPGHMLKAQQRLAEEIKQADLVLELRDARLPRRSANPKLAEIAGPRPRLVVLNKASLADPRTAEAWSKALDAAQTPHLLVDADSRQGMAALLDRIAALTQASQDKLRARGIRPPPPRVVIVGLPNVGKSTLINRLAKRQRAKTAPMPGVTRHLTWIAVEDRFLLMDSPGIMLPRIENEADALALTWIGAVKDAVLGPKPVAEALLRHMLTHAVAPPPHTWWPEEASRAGAVSGMEATQLLDEIGKRRGFLAAGGAVDPAKTAQFLLEQYREGGLGRMTFDAAP